MSGINYSRLVPPDSFIGRYMAHMEAQETAQAYDFFGALWLMSLAMRGCVVARPRAPVHLNLYCIMVAESGTTRKSTAVRVARDVAQAYMVGAGVHIGLVEAKTTPEQLEVTLAKAGDEHGYSFSAIVVSELVIFLGREKYNLSMPGLLTDLYDCPRERRSPGTVSRGSVTLRQVYVCFLSASTPTWLARAVSPDVIEGGFTSRCLFIVAEGPKRRIAWPASEHTRSEAFTDLFVRELQGLSEAAARASKLGGIRLNDTALKTFTRWYNTRKTNLDPFRASFESREDAHVLRVAAYLCANDASWVISAAHIKASIKVVAEVKSAGARLFEGAGSRSSLLIGVDKLRDRLLEAGQEAVSQTRLYLSVKNYLSASDVRTLLAIMHELDMVQRFEVGHAGAGRPSTLWRGTKNLLARDMMATVMETYDG